MFGLQLPTIIGGAILALLFTGFAGTVIWSIRENGVQSERHKTERRDAGDTQAGLETNAKVQQAITEATAGLARDNAQLHGELENARARLRQLSRRPPPPGAVAGDAVLDPEFSRAFLCELSRVRGDDAAAAPAWCDAERGAVVDAP